MSSETSFCILEDIRNWVLSQKIPFTVIGAHRIDLNVQPSIQERLFSFDLYVSQSNYTGAAYSHHNSSQDCLLKAIGLTNANISTRKLSRPVEISILDSVLNVDRFNCSDRQLLSGSLTSKAIQRARIIRDLAKSHFKPKGEIHLIGYVSLVAEQLIQCGFKVISYDNDKNLLQPNKYNILPGNSFYGEFKRGYEAGRVSGCIATGMTVVNDSFNKILTMCESMSIPIGLYAESGSSFAPLYRDLGIRFVLAERFPFYVFHGDNVVYIFD